MAKQSRVNEEKLLNDLFVLLEYSDNIKEFVEGMNQEMFDRLLDVMTDRAQQWTK
jgi:hypothetical protein